MSLIGRTTDDYTPLRAPIRNEQGRDIRPHKERQQYEQAVNARREMLNVIGSQVAKKLSKKEYERLRAIKTPVNGDPELTAEQRRVQRFNADGRARCALKTMLKGVALSVSENDDGE